MEEDRSMASQPGSAVHSYRAASARPRPSRLAQLGAEYLTNVKVEGKEIKFTRPTFAPELYWPFADAFLCIRLRFDQILPY